ncbi:hypothetical protein [Serratia quinivorans]|uniref:hypothetical protein n=1 Tax=Serratia quinivorans TaxID=137545 RepID=UPI003F6EE986
MENTHKELRDKIKKSQSSVMGPFNQNHNVNICFFCGSEDGLTKEHVMPQWVFSENKGNGFFNATINEQPQKYIHSTIPACHRCNNVLLSAVEDYVKNVLLVNTAGNYTDREVDFIIWWLEIIEYKLQILDLRRKFVRRKGDVFIPFLANIPLGIMREGAKHHPLAVLRQVRAARREIGKKWKAKRFNSIVFFETTNTNMHFFHKTSEFIFLEIPQVGMAVFFFYNEGFETQFEARDKAMKIIKENY